MPQWVANLRTLTDSLNHSTEPNLHRTTLSVVYTIVHSWNRSLTDNWIHYSCHNSGRNATPESAPGMSPPEL